MANPSANRKAATTCDGRRSVSGIALRALAGLLGVVLLYWGYQLIAVRGTFAPSRPVADAGGNALLVGPPGERIAGRIYLSGSALPSAPVVMVLHGDAPFVNPGYQYAFASNLARSVAGVRVAALLRPGYADPYGAKSDGDRGFATGENYTRATVDQLAAAMKVLQLQWRAPAVIVVGHSGGAALAADIAALYPDWVSHTFLVGCPCDVPAFRKHMARFERDPLWLLPVRSLSPMATLDGMRENTVITAISGDEDPIALPEYAEAYVAKAKRLGIDASMIVLPGKGHEILLEPAVINVVAQALSSHGGTTRQPAPATGPRPGIGRRRPPGITDRAQAHFVRRHSLLPGFFAPWS